VGGGSTCRAFGGDSGGGLKLLTFGVFEAIIFGSFVVLFKEFRDETYDWAGFSCFGGGVSCVCLFMRAEFGVIGGASGEG